MLIELSCNGGVVVSFVASIATSYVLHCLCPLPIIVLFNLIYKPFIELLHFSFFLSELRLQLLYLILKHGLAIGVSWMLQLFVFQVDHDMGHFVALDKFRSTRKSTTQTLQLGIKGWNQSFRTKLAVFGMRLVHTRMDLEKIIDRWRLGLVSTCTGQAHFCICIAAFTFQ